MAKAPPALEILLVEDDPDIAESLCDLLESSGHSVETARHGAEALERLRKQRADVVLLDLMMPVMDGYEFRNRQLADPHLARVPVIVMTADPRAPERQGELKPFLLLGKPLNLSQLDEALENIAKRKAS